MMRLWPKIYGQIRKIGFRASVANTSNLSSVNVIYLPSDTIGGFSTFHTNRYRSSKSRRSIVMPTNNRKRKKNEEAEVANTGEKTPLTKELVDMCLKNMRMNFEHKDGKPQLEAKNKKDTGASKPSGRRGVKKERDVSVKSEPELKTSPKTKRRHVKIEFDNAESKEECKKNNSTKWFPKKWDEVLANIRQMRSTQDAPVDEMGCDKCPDESASPHIMRYQTLISLMLSSQTKDQVTYAAMQRLKEHGLNIDNILKTSDENLGKLIYPVGFWKTKVKYIKKSTQMLKDEYDGDIPNNVEDLCKLPGVGPKMAHLCMKSAWNKITGIAVDTHVHRISNRLGWVQKTTKTPEATQQELQSWLPEDLWWEINHLLVGFGQTICQPVKPRCESCLNADLCPYSRTNKKSRKPK